MSSSNCHFLACIQVLQETGKMAWYSHLFKNFPQFVVIHIVKGFNTVNETEVDFFFLKFPCFFYDPTDVGNFDFSFLYIFWIQLVYLEVPGSHTAEASLEGFCALPC